MNSQVKILRPGDDGALVLKKVVPVYDPALQVNDPMRVGRSYAKHQRAKARKRAS